jgi:hypothetical protein
MRRYQLLSIARKSSHVIEEDQCVSNSFLMGELHWLTPTLLRTIKFAPKL